MWKHSNAWRVAAWIVNFVSLILIVLSIMAFVFVYNQNYSLHYDWKNDVDFVQSSIFKRKLYEDVNAIKQSDSYSQLLERDLTDDTTLNAIGNNIIFCIDRSNGILTNGDLKIVKNWMERSRELDADELNQGNGDTNFYDNNILYRLVAVIRTDGENKEVESYYAYGSMKEAVEELINENNHSDVYVFLDNSFHDQDEFSRLREIYSVGKNCYRITIGLIPVMIILYILSFIYLIVSAGHKKGVSEICLKRHDKIPGEFMLFILSIVPIVGLNFLIPIAYVGTYGVGYYYEESNIIMYMIPITIMLICGYLICMIWLMRIVRRKKAGITYWDTSIFHIVIRKIGILYNAREEVGRLMMLLGGGMLSFLIALLMSGGDGLFALAGWIGVILIPILVLKQLFQEAVWRNQIYKGIDAIVQGKTGYKIHTSEMRANEKKAGEQINHLGEGLQRAVVEATKNERLKAELITNVSHDIKTPLTSIINYVDLIKRENIENEKIKEYVKVLDEKSQRLKHLTEDLVEASKANTGNLTLNMEKIDFMQLIYQTLGEFQDKFEERELKTVVKLDKSPVWIYADGRRVWRVMENLLQNVYKYAMPQTRVYIESVTTSKKTVVTIKNISENPLNIPASELTERFIRGDVARTTEGSGLGLSIAKSLMELMDGEFELYLDGDLFRATIGFNRMGAEKEPEEKVKKEDGFDWEAFIKKSNQEEEEKQEKTDKAEKVKKTEKTNEKKSLKRKKVTLLSMWKELGNEVKNLGNEVKDFNLKEKK